MPVSAVWLKVEVENVAGSIERVIEALESGEREVVLDFSAIRRIDASAVRAMEKLAGAADDKNVKAVLCGVNVDVYKVLKLTKLTARFSFLA